MEISTEIYIFGKKPTTEYVEKLNAVICEGAFEISENKIISSKPFHNISKLDNRRILDICSDGGYFFLSSWFSDDLGSGFYLFLGKGKVVELQSSLSSGIEKTEDEFIEFCGLSEIWNLNFSIAKMVKDVS